MKLEGEALKAMDGLRAVALERLGEMWDEGKSLFSHKARLEPGGIENSGSNTLYSAMCLVGLGREGSPQARALLERVETTYSAVAEAARATSDVSLLATAAWALALANHPEREAVVRVLLSTLRPRRATSMELGLVLAGLEQAPAALGAEGRAASDAAVAELRSRFCERSGLFRGTAVGASRHAVVHHGITSFASQVYPLVGLSARARNDSQDIPELRRCGERLASMQGPDGQWWWLYAPSKGGVVERYPVYSVHQHGMAFMALAGLEALGLGRFTGELAKGLAWVNGKNELGVRLFDAERRFVYRAIQRRGSDPDGYGGLSRAQHVAVVLASFAGRRENPGASLGPDRLELLAECRPYELGWLLYGSALVPRASS